MCLCNGTGGVQIEHTWGIEFHPCPDSNCKFDRNESEIRYEDWKTKMFEQMECDVIAKT